MSSLSMKDIHKSFDSNEVLKGVNFSVKKGEVHALLGMNGAGKSTLMKILSGDEQPTSGSMTIDSKSVQFQSPLDAIHSGIGMVVQEVDTSLFPTLPIYENITNLNEQKKLFISKKEQKTIANKALKRVQLSLDVNELIQNCSLQEKQLILLAKVLSSSATYIILDEPTAPLSETETAILFQIIRQLKNEGVSIIYISHRLSEIKEICDSVTILRDGAVEYTGSSSLSIDEMIQHMVGKSFDTSKKQTRSISEKKLLQLTDLEIPHKKSSVNLTLHEGEIVGVAGLVGAGKTELAEAIFGLSKAKGKMEINGNKAQVSSPADAIKAGIALIPEERRRQGLFVDESVSVNVTLQLLKQFTSFQWIQKNKEKGLAADLINRLNIKPNSTTIPARLLSGGNQQKVVIGKWLQTDSSIFLFDEPTKGIDVHAKKEVFEIIHDLTEQGKGVLYFSSEWQELLDLSDKIVILYDGKIVKTLSREEATFEKLVYYATGGDENGANHHSRNEDLEERLPTPLSF
ncbi:sugar ABC transporter ATP-binding protein [Metabacillus herbersteinensis]